MGHAINFIYVGLSKNNIQGTIIIIDLPFKELGTISSTYIKVINIRWITPSASIHFKTTIIDKTTD